METDDGRVEKLSKRLLVLVVRLRVDALRFVLGFLVAVGFNNKWVGNVVGVDDGRAEKLISKRLLTLVVAFRVGVLRIVDWLLLCMVKYIGTVVDLVADSVCGFSRM